jgi:hypothetical protein
MSLCLSRAVVRQQQLLLRRAPFRSASSTSEVASAAKEKTAATASKAQDGLSRVTSSAGSAVGKAGEVAGKVVGGIGGRTGRLIGAVQCMSRFSYRELDPTTKLSFNWIELESLAPIERVRLMFSMWYSFDPADYILLQSRPRTRQTRLQRSKDEPTVSLSLPSLPASYLLIPTGSLSLHLRSYSVINWLTLSQLRANLPDLFPTRHQRTKTPSLSLHPHHN